MELIGRQFGHIRVTEVVGEGGMGAVYAGHDTKLDRKVALKVLHADQRLDDEARERLLREARALSRVDHPNICRIHDYIETGDVDLLVLEYIDGRTLQAAIANGLPHAEKLRIALAIAEVLVRAHRAGIVHRDLKPENVMITKRGVVKVLDFGLARWLHRSRKSSDGYSALPESGGYAKINDNGNGRDQDHSLGDTAVLPAARPLDIYPSGRREFLATAAGITLGTPLYMSPEQARGEALTPASDMFSFGLLLQVLFTGKEPHTDMLSAREVILRVARGETDRVEGAPKDMAALINNLKMFAPADRLTAVQMVKRLQYLMEKPQRIARRSIAAGFAAIMLFGGWRYTVDLDRERSIAVEQRTVAQQEKAKAEDLINFMVDDLRKKLEPVGRLDVLEAPAEKVLQYVQGLRPEAMSVEELARHAKVLNQLGEVRVGLGKTTDALQLFSTSLGLATAAVERDGRNPDALLVLGATQYWLGHAQHQQGKTREALHHMREYQRTAEKLAALDRNNREYQLERAYGHGNVASMLEQMGQVRESLPHHHASLQITKELAGTDTMQGELAIAYNKVGVALAKAGELRAAIDNLRQEGVILRALSAADDKDMRIKHRLATNLAWHARVLLFTGEEAAALSLWREEIELERELFARDPNDVTKHRAVAVTMRRIAGGTARAGQHAQAIEMYRAAQREIADVIAKAPTRNSYVVDAAAIDTDYGLALSRSGRTAAASDAFRGAIERLEKLKEPGRFGQMELARAYLSLGDLETNPGRAQDAWQRAERMSEPLAAATTDPSDLALLARVLIRRNRFAEARAIIARLEPTGFAMGELTELCRKSGC